MLKLAEVQKQTRSGQLASTKKPESATLASATYPVLAQRSMGNQVLQRMLHIGAIRAKIKIGQPDDEYEREADRIAEQVMRMPDPREDESTFPSHPQSITIQRASPEYDHEMLYKQLLKDDEDEEIPQKKEAFGQTPEVTPELATQISDLRGKGQPLPKSARTFFEPRLGFDFSRVRIHSDEMANGINERLRSRAFTIGLNIFFKRDEYNIYSFPGLRLLAHELTHVIHQSNDKIATGNRVKEHPGQSEGIFQLPVNSISNTFLNESTIQRTGPGPGTITSAPPNSNIKIFIFNIDDIYIENMHIYIRDTLGVPETDIHIVDTFEQIFEILNSLSPSLPPANDLVDINWRFSRRLRPSATTRIPVDRIIIVSHGRTYSEGSYEEGQIRERQGWLSVSQVDSLASNAFQRVRRLLGPDVIVELWGCNIGQHFLTLRAYSRAFGNAEVSAPTRQTEPGAYRRFGVRRNIEGRRGSTLVWIRNSADVRPEEETLFRRYLIQIYNDLANNYEIRETDPPRDDEAKYQYIRDLFDRSRGDIFHFRLIEEETPIRPGEGLWRERWQRERNPPSLVD